MVLDHTTRVPVLIQAVFRAALLATGFHLSDDEFQRPALLFLLWYSRSPTARHRQQNSIVIYLGPDFHNIFLFILIYLDLSWWQHPESDRLHLNCAQMENKLDDCRTYLGADCDTDHQLLVAMLKVRLSKRQRQNSIPPLNLEELKEDKAVQFTGRSPRSSHFPRKAILNSVQITEQLLLSPMQARSFFGSYWRGSE